MNAGEWWPSHTCTCLAFRPGLNKRVAHVCRSVCNPAHGTPAVRAAAFTARYAVAASSKAPYARTAAARVAGRGSARRTSPPPRRATPVWSPVAQQIAFLRTEYDARGERIANSLRVVDVKTRRQRRLAPDVKLSATPVETYSNMYDFAWSPQGTRLAYLARGGIYVVSRDGRMRRRLVSGALFLGIDSITFSPDGRRIVFAARRAS